MCKCFSCLFHSPTVFFLNTCYFITPHIFSLLLRICYGFLFLTSSFVDPLFSSICVYSHTFMLITSAQHLSTICNFCLITNWTVIIYDVVQITNSIYLFWWQFFKFVWANRRSSLPLCPVTVIYRVVQKKQHKVNDTIILQPCVIESCGFQQNVPKEILYMTYVSIWIQQLNILCYCRWQLNNAKKYYPRHRGP